MLGQGGTTWRMADALPPDADGWQKVAVDPSVVAARVAGVSYGFLLFDDTGSEWKRDGDKFTPIHMPNRFVHSREAGPATRPYLTVYLGAEDKAPPAAPTNLRGEAADLPAGEAWLSWVTPKDEGPAGTVGFFVTHRRQGGSALSHSAGRRSRRPRADAPARPGLAAGARGQGRGAGRGRGRQRRPRGRGDGEAIRPQSRGRCRARRRAVRRRGPAAEAGRRGGRGHRRAGQGAAGHRRDDPEAGRRLPRRQPPLEREDERGPAARRPQRVRRLPGAAARRRQGRAADADVRRRRRQGPGDVRPLSHHSRHEKGPLPDPIVPLADGMDVPSADDPAGASTAASTSRSTSRTTRRPATTRAS